VVGIIPLPIVKEDRSGVASETSLRIAGLTGGTTIFSSEMTVVMDLYSFLFVEGLFAHEALGGGVVLMLLVLGEGFHCLATMLVIPFSNGIHFPLQPFQKLRNTASPLKGVVGGMYVCEGRVGNHEEGSSNGAVVL
jgi:hypothetical protein